MSRKIDWSEPLSDEDRAWAEQRWDMPAGVQGMSIGQMVAANDQEHGKAAKDARKSLAERIEDAQTQITDLTLLIERLQKEQADMDRENAAFSGTPDERAKGLGFVDNTPVDGQAPAGSAANRENYTDNHWTVAKLQSELGSRNQERTSQGLEALPTTGTKAELIERLQKDDEELEG